MLHIRLSKERHQTATGPFQLIRGRERGQSLDDFQQEAASAITTLARRENLFGVIMAQASEAQNGRASALEQKCSTFMRMNRGPNDDTVEFLTRKSNYSRLVDIRERGGVPKVIFSMQGPHFRTPTEEDLAMMRSDT